MGKSIDVISKFGPLCFCVHGDWQYYAGEFKVVAYFSPFSTYRTVRITNKNKHYYSEPVSIIMQIITLNSCLGVLIFTLT
jgi:hypothetical protein